MATAPLLMLPLRLETRLTEDLDSVLVVDVRAYPDQIHVDSARKTMSLSEQFALKELYAAKTEGPEFFAAARARITPAIGAGRLEYLLQAHERGALPPLSGADWDEAPAATCLPEYLVMVVRMTDGKELTAQGKYLPKTVPMAPAQGDTNAFSGSRNDPLLWMSDFDAAMEIGLACRLRLEAGMSFSTIASVEVIGIPRATSDEDSEYFERLINAQRQSVGLGLHPAGKPTKTQAPTLKGMSRKASLTAEGALGLKAGALGDPETRIDGNAATQPCARLVWAAAVRPALLQGWHIERGQELAPPNWIDDIADRFINSLTPEGPFPVLSIGNQPYGIHIMSPPNTPSKDRISSIIRKHLPELASAAEARRDDLNNNKGAWPALLDHLTRADQSGTWRRRRLHPLVSWINLVLNTDGPSSHEVFQAPKTRREKLDGMGLTGFAKGRAGLMVAGDPTNRLIDLPLAAPDAEYSDAPLQLDALEALLAAPLDMFFGKIRESNSVSVLHLLALSALRWGILEYAAALKAGGDRNVAFRILGYNVDYTSEPSGWNALIHEVFGERVENMPLKKLLLTFRPSGPEQERVAGTLNALITALEEVQKLPGWQVHRALAGALDTASFRFDVWETADAMHTLQQHRASNAQDLALGAYGFLEGNGFGAWADSPVFRAAPSVEHAATAAALHQAKDSLKDSGEQGIADIDLTSERVRNALEFAESLRRGLDPAEALGRFAERFVARAGRAELTPSLARALPLRGKPEPDDAILRIDGIRLLDHARSGTLGALRADFDSGPARLSEVFGWLINALASAVIEVSDGYADLCTAEGLHRLMNGRPEAAQAAFEALGGGGPPPQDFAVVDSTPSGHALQTSIALLAKAQAADMGTLDSVVPGLASIAEALLPPISGRISAQVETEHGNEVSDLGLSELGLTALELMVAARPDQGPETVLRPAIRLKLAATGTRGTLKVITLNRDAQDWWWAAGRTASVIIQARAFSQDDLPGAVQRGDTVRDAEQASARNAAGDALGTLLQEAANNADTAPETAVRLLLRIGDTGEAVALSESILQGAAEPGFGNRIRGAVEAYLSLSPENRIEKLLPGLPIPHRFVLTPQSSRRDVSLAGQLPSTEWIEGLQTVEPALWPLSDLLLAGADERLSERAMQGAPGIDANEIPAAWIGGKIDPASLAQSIDGLLAFSPTPVVDGTEVIGLHVASWREILARSQSEIGVAARVPIPPGRAANALVLVTPTHADAWSTKTLLECLAHLRNQIKTRSLDLQSLPGSSPPVTGEPVSDNLGLFLPLLWLPPAPFSDPEFL
jgi:hypothetical protein